MNRILVVDDEEQIRRVYKSLLERKGYLVTTAPNAEEARKFLKAFKVDVLLLDINMGYVRGDDLYEVMQCFHRDIKIIVSSVYPIEEQQSLMPLADDYFDKAEGNRVLLEKVRRVLGKF
jgi:CheY-like chemotaxis protein